ncbi:MAG TPA: glycosyltransferase family 2 protein, partial [Terriglobales bacterium]|nr:glycosyltransferase family 2 protein [Terriglobales bacterium]
MDPSSAPSVCRVAAIIPALHRPDLTARCIESVLQQGLPQAEFEIIVVENESAKGPILSDPLPPRTRRLLLSANLGFTGAVNRGVRESSSEYVFLLNNDIELASGCLRLLLERVEVDPAVAIAGGRLLNAADHSVLDGAGDALLLGGGAYRLGHGHPDPGWFDSNEVLACCGAALLVRRKVFEQLDGLDEQFFAYLDDMDLALRARLAGHKIAYVPEACAFHVGSATLGERLHPKMVEWMTRNQILLVLKNYPAGLLIRLLLRIKVFQLLWFWRAVAERRVGAWFRGMLGVCGNLFSILRKRRLVQMSRRISSAELLEALRRSESQIAAWQSSLPGEKRSRL